MKKYSIFLLFIIFFATACTQLQQIGFRSYETTFSQNLDNHTIEKKLYRDFETVAIAKVTYFDSNLANQYYDYLAQNNAISNTNKKIYESFKNDSKQKFVFWINLYSSNFEPSNISDKNSFWNIYLECDGKQIQPSKIVKVPEDSPLNAWLYLKPRNYWSQNYIVEFDKNCKSNIFDLKMSSIVGSLSFNFR